MGVAGGGGAVRVKPQSITFTAATIRGTDSVCVPTNTTAARRQDNGWSYCSVDETPKQARRIRAYTKQNVSSQIVLANG